MQLADFDFDLPPDLIALRPAEPRDAARLLVVGQGGRLEDRVFSDLPGLLRPGDALVLNDTRVIPARLFGRRARGESVVAVEATLHRRLAPDRWNAFMRPGKRLAVGDRIVFGFPEDRACALSGLGATVTDKGEGGEVTLAFELAGPDLDQAIEDHGLMPLPPYIAARRPEDERDRRDYQTLYARERGSVAAPTAGLHFTPVLLERLAAAGVSVHFVTLHVGAGTFLPVKSETIAEHRMHAEYGEVSADVADAVSATRAKGGRIVCVGTTSLRLLESATDESGTVRPFAGETAIFITPGYRFRAADGLVTNFHLPRSTLFMLVAALGGLEAMRGAYAHAIANDYRFYSYGDACLIWRTT
ncbi:MAG: S-adenosylmethionine/tRNA-ribosyltransferase-isomerase [Caulobacteraceae bacterium]|nr:S-adenosylmethionine/tRNA-ribosyltransferase-isomerase [Caulobacteraceae bacterium]